MKILTITAQFPPFHHGGYEIRIKNIMDGLAERGHTILVLTNLPKQGEKRIKDQQPYTVIDKLHNRYKAKSFLKEIIYDILDTQLIEHQINRFQPDLIYLGHIYILSKMLLPFLARQKRPIIYDEGGSGLIEAWTEHGRWFRFCGDYYCRFSLMNWIKPVFIRMVIAISQGRLQNDWTWPHDMNIIFNSEQNQMNAQAAIVPISNSTVIHSGIDTKKFTFKSRERFGNPLKIIVPGRIESRKGQLDAIHLVKELENEGIKAELLMAGAITDMNYFEKIEKERINCKVEEISKSIPMLMQSGLIDLYHNSDICFFSSHQSFGFSRTPLEAMACGCIVISYGNEGSDEVIDHMKTGFVVPDEEIGLIVQIIKSLLIDQNYSNEIRLLARKIIEDYYSLNGYLDKIEIIIDQQIES